ncbi:hypothetical protein ACFE04_031029 [Oxalis oulophora]
MVNRKTDLVVQWLICILLLLLLMIIESSTTTTIGANFFNPYNVSYDNRAMIIDGERRMLISAGIHYPRATPQMWPDLLAKCKEGGADVIQTYVFWNGHEPVRGQYNFEGRYDLVHFVKLVGASGLYLHLRIGPYVCAEWNFGGFPVWLRDVPGVEFRTDNGPFKDEMQKFVKKIVDMMREENLLSWQGGPIIMMQIENEYGNIEHSFGQKGKDYVKWAAKMAVGLEPGIPWVMCQQTDAPDYIFFGGTNFGRTSGGPLITTTYDYDAPIDEYGLLSQPKWGHLKDLHAAIKLCEPALVAADTAHYINLGPNQEAHVYGAEGLNISWQGIQSPCSAFLANIDEHKSASVTFLGQSYTLPPWSVSILPDCRNVVFNTAKVGAQISIKTAEFGLPLLSAVQSMNKNKHSSVSKSWMTIKETTGIWSQNNFTEQGIWEHLNVTKDWSDYLWLKTRLYVSADDIAYWKKSRVNPAIVIDSMRDVLTVFINEQLAGSVDGHWIKVIQPVQFKQGYNDLVLLSETVGFQNYGAFFEQDGGGFRGQVKITGFRNGDVDLRNLFWTYQVGLKGEFLELYSEEETPMASWGDLSLDAIPSAFTWYKTYFDTPDGDEPVAVDLGSMGKGQAWVNGHHIGRYWTRVAPKNGCGTCDYRGAYYSSKCTTNCGEPTQTWYHIPRSWLRESDNLLVIFEEVGGNPFEITIKLRSTRTVCAQVSESHYAPVGKWSQVNLINGKVSKTDRTPEIHLQCEPGHVISSIEFASYGTPQGSCQKFSTSNCHAPNSLSIVSKACLERNSCSLQVSNSVFGIDPCRHIVKTLAVEAKCVLSSGIGSFQL